MSLSKSKLKTIIPYKDEKYRHKIFIFIFLLFFFVKKVQKKTKQKNGLFWNLSSLLLLYNYSTKC